MTTFVCTYQKTKASREAAFVATGERAKEQSVQIDDTELSPAGRELLLLARGRLDGMDREGNWAEGPAHKCARIYLPLIDRDSAPGIGDVEAALAASIEWTRARTERKEAEEVERAVRDADRREEHVRELQRALARSRRLAALLRELDLVDARLLDHATPDAPLGFWSADEATAAIRERVLPAEIGNICEYEELDDCDECRVTAMTGSEYVAVRRGIEVLRAGLPLVPAANPLHTREVWSRIFRHKGERLEIAVSVDMGDGVTLEREYAIVA